ncbi:DNA-binding protein [Acinetobacter wanghuae]|uniref:DNA-binding protein n=1 Tax=Acinetobacter wanghuae TaxID=2662362 RepID=A0ABX6CZR9_9GAMM|nr:phage antirepressor KilAC domain-containing protein [Acinetobacter wanghuae]QGA11028.1 DNA-binding protein [Acinetobacter wanghuae]
MNSLSQFNADSKSMSSLEISELVQSRHDKVKQSIERLVERGVIAQPPMGNVEKINNLGFSIQVGIYIFSGEKGKRDSIIVVAQLCPEFTARLVDRWMELENYTKSVVPQIPQSFAEALQLAADQARQLELAAPKVAHYDAVVAKGHLLTATQVGAKVGLSAVALNRILDNFRVYNKAHKRSRVFNTWFEDQGFGELKQTTTGHSQPMFTTKGEAWVIEKLVSEGVAA